MSPKDFLSMMKNGKINSDEIMEMFGGKDAVNKMRVQALNGVIDKTIDVLYEEYPKDAKATLFVKDPRRSEKEQAIVALVTKSVPIILTKMNEADVSLIYDKIQSKKESTNE